MEAGGGHECRRVDCTPPQWKKQEWKVEFIRRRSSHQFDILITTPPPKCKKIRSLKALTSYVTENNITSLSLEDLNSRSQRILWKKKSLEGLCICGHPEELSTPFPSQHQEAVENSQVSRSNNVTIGQDGAVEKCCDLDGMGQPCDGDLSVENKLGFEVHSTVNRTLPCGIITSPEIQSRECFAEVEVSGSNFSSDESHVLNSVRGGEATRVARLLDVSSEVPVEGVVGPVAVDRRCGEELEEVEDLPPSGSRCSAGLPALTSSESDNTADGGCGSMTSSPARAQRPRRKRSQYFRKRGSVGNSRQPPPCAPRKNTWLPPRSPFGLIQEDLYHDPFQLLVATILLNKTRGEAATPVIWRLLGKWPTAEATLGALEEDIVSVIQPLGLHRKRAFIIKKFADEFLSKPWTYPDELYGISKYGTDSYRIFCVNEWRDTRPTDHMLLKYVKWLADQLKESSFL